MPLTFELIGEAFKALTQRAISRRLGFSPSRYSGGSYSAGELSLRHAVAQTGSSLDYENAAGDVLSNSVVAACVNAICQALPEAPILLEKRVGGNEFERVDLHPVLDLLHNPNPYLSEAELWGVTTAFERTRGEAFWYFEYGADRTVPREIWFRAPEYVQVLSDTARFISGYNITSESGQVVSLDEGDVVHFRHQLSVVNSRAGWAPIQTGKRQIVGDNGAATYHSAILRNAGTASLIISLKDAAAAGEVTPGQIDEYVQLFKRKVMGEGSGAILGMDLPLDVHKVGFSPDEMALDRLLEYYESRICALMGVNRRVINLGSDPTYENSKVALNDFWERTIVQMRRRHASTLSSQLLPLFGLDPAIYRLRFDFSEVEALRENVDALHARWRETFVAGGIDLFTFQEKIGLVPDESYRGRYLKASSPIDVGEDEIKASSSIDWDESKHPRDEDGKWTSGGGRVLRSKLMQAGITVLDLHQEHGDRKERRQNRRKSAGLSHAEMERVQLYLPKFLAEKMAAPSEQDANLDAMGTFELHDMSVSRIEGVSVTGTELAEAKDALRKIGVGLQVGTHDMKLDALNMVAAFDWSVPPAVLVRENPSIYELAHEVLHAIHWHELGVEEYSRLTDFEKEAFVYRGLAGFFKSGILNYEEITHAQRYIKHVYDQFESHLRPSQ